MFTWIMNNISTIVICTILLVTIAGIIVRMIKNKKQGKFSCGCGCQGCAMSKSCRGRN